MTNADFEEATKASVAASAETAVSLYDEFHSQVQASGVKVAALLEAAMEILSNVVYGGQDAASLFVA